MSDTTDANPDPNSRSQFSDGNTVGVTADHSNNAYSKFKQTKSEGNTLLDDYVIYIMVIVVIFSIF